ncbi:TIGR03086 family metal-binding protein [Streptomyces boncukensis]|uniref:TIGR03086 family protein n=1 Tax=Streptomyces boncukensis TaxID=2711219 RepID=A0A6G4X4J0_9ACTN|nr:TIGR03086 family metal-binding protein [Streptomyces boncukensis]NGO72446.1 TIGR03086 family protein [Streptomyces boncukensis]
MNVLTAFDTAFDTFDSTVRTVRDDQWAAPTACAGWSAKDLVNHLVSEHLWAPHLLRKETLAQVGDRYDGDVTDGAPIAAWERASAASRPAFHAPGALEGEVHVTDGRIPAPMYAWQMTTDLAVHAWDLAQGIGADVRLPEELAQALHAQAQPYVTDTGQPGLFDAPVPLPGAPDWHSRLLALLGRDPRPS